MIFGSSRDFLFYPAGPNAPGYSRFLRGEDVSVGSFDLYHTDGKTKLDPYEHMEVPWDVSIETWADWDGETVLYAGVMDPPPGRTHARYDRDNKRRRVFAFRCNRGRWVRESDPLTWTVGESWIGRSYGHHFLEDEQGRVWIFYERVSRTQNDWPWKTEIFAREMLSPYRASRREHRILSIGEKPYPATLRQHGGALMEGARPFRLTLQAEEIYVISFSSGDFATDHYGLNLAWSRSVLGPYRPVLNERGDDLKNFGSEIKRRFNLGWGPSRAAFFAERTGQNSEQWWVLFHAADARLWPEHDFSKWPEDWTNLNVFRTIYLTAARFSWRQRSNGHRDVWLHLAW
ncbi:MAG: hypothetical protein AB7P49_04705 [Bdellovibrionales bacterium]